MEVVILCGGQGTRIRDVAEDIPKPMIPIGGRPILWHIMKGYAHHGLHQFVLCLGYKSAVIKRYFLDYYANHTDFTVNLARPQAVRFDECPIAENWQVTMAETGLDAMTGCRIKRIQKYITGDTFLLTYGDGVADVDITQLLAFHRSHGKIGTVTAVRPPGRFGQIDLDGHRVVEFNEKPLESGGWINGGFFVFQSRLFDFLEDDPELIFEYAPLQELTRTGQLMAYRHNGFWQPMDNIREHKYLNELWEAGAAPWRTWETPRRYRAAA
jgi:glucose-1-phosphate cytidylyltransferase